MKLVAVAALAALLISGCTTSEQGIRPIPVRERTDFEATAKSISLDWGYRLYRVCDEEYGNLIYWVNGDGRSPVVIEGGCKK